jgi:hypothetical protein
MVHKHDWLFIPLCETPSNLVTPWTYYLFEMKEKQYGLRTYFHRARVAHICNPSYSGGRDEEDHSLKQPSL